MPNGRLSPLAKVSVALAPVPLPFGRSTRMRLAELSATKMSPFDATRSEQIHAAVTAVQGAI